MRYFTIIVLAFCICVSARGQNAKPRPLDGALDNPTPAQIIFSTNSNETQYLGFNWVSFYCFGAVLGCIQTDRPATSSWITRIVVFSVGDWRVAADCRDQTPVPMSPTDTTGVKFQLHNCASEYGQAMIQIRKNERSLTVGASAKALKKKNWFGHGPSVYVLEGAYNVKTEQTFGDCTAEQWKLLIAELRMQQDLQAFQPQIAVKLIEQLKDLRQYNLVTTDRLEKLLEQDEQENAALVHVPPK